MQKQLNNEILQSGQIVTLNRSEIRDVGNMGCGILKDYIGKHSGNIEVWSIWWSFNGMENVFGFLSPSPIEPVKPE